ncbi:MAG: NUDIX domain-containing protein [bacterium]|nr:NUDIX domain-containing protein [bacterium]
MEKKFKIRCRGIIIDKEEILVVEHPGQEYFAFPGGKLELGEGVLECMEREIIEELGIKPTIGRLLYVNTFVSGGIHTTEFLFEILNGLDYRDFEKQDRTHAFELAEVAWVNKDTDARILPEKVANDFKNRAILSDMPKFIKD